MKKTTSLLIAIVIVLSCTFIFTGCMPVDPAGTIEGYKLYNNGDISFEYPEEWTRLPFVKEFAKMDMIMDLGASGNNLNVLQTEASYDFESVDLDDLKVELGNTYENQGLVVSNLSIAKDTTNNVQYIIVTYDTDYSGTSMHQTQLFAFVGDGVYIITISETAPDSAIVETVIATLTYHK